MDGGGAVGFKLRKNSNVRIPPSPLAEPFLYASTDVKMHTINLAVLRTTKIWDQGIDIFGSDL